MEPDEERAVESLDRFLDALARGRPPMGEGLDPALAEAAVRLRDLAARIAPDWAFPGWLEAELTGPFAALLTSLGDAALSAGRGDVEQAALLLRAVNAQAARHGDAAYDWQRGAYRATEAATRAALEDAFDRIRGGERRPTQAQVPAELTPREKEVLRLVAEGLTDTEIGAALSISRRTVTTHIENIFGKLGVRSRTEAVVFADQRGLI